MEVLLVVILSCSILPAVRASGAPRLAQYNVSEELISVSGLSSGAYFAVQFHVAFSSSIMGAGVVAGGPFWCANDDVEIALSSCMKTPEAISVKELVDITYSTALTDTIDKPTNMKNHKVYLFSGSKDTVVAQGVVKKLEEYYTHFTQNVAAEYSIPAEHSMVTESYGNDCDHFGSPYINKCGYSAAYHILQQIYGDVKTTNLSSSGKPGNLLEFSQSEFFADVPGAVSMDKTGYIYVPTECRDGKKECRLHIAFHGCLQGRMFVSDAFAMHAGYNGLAEENNIIVLYPQTVNSTVPFNPKGCWDWWGYTAPSYASKLGPQMAGVKLMVNRVSSKRAAKNTKTMTFLLLKKVSRGKIKSCD